MTATASDVLHNTAHRPWPLPPRPWIMYQDWRDLLFAHWPVPYAELRRHVPLPFELQEHDGSAWVGLTPFFVDDLRPRGLPTAPGLSNSAELNLRTYVKVDGKPGVFFFSLDIESRLAALGARLFYRLPYHVAQMKIDKTTDGSIVYQSQRQSEEAVFEACYRPVGASFLASRSDLEQFLFERYAMFSMTRKGSIVRGEIHHGPWCLQQAEATIRRNTIADASGIHLPTMTPLLHFAARQQAVIWPPSLIDAQA